MQFLNIYDVFISYRRSDGFIIAEALYKYLTSKGLRVFFDKHEMIDGHYFTTQIATNLKIAPNYILVATDDVFKFRKNEDWVRKEIEVAIEEYESNPIERTITVLVPESVAFPEKVNLPNSVRNIADAQRIALPYGEDFAEPFYKALKAVTNINRRNLWFAAHRWLENSKQPGGRFANLNINESILPNASKNKTEQKSMPINVYSKENENKNRQSLFEAMDCNGNHLYLIGQGGIGKTTALMHIMNNAYVDKQYSENAQIPLFIELSFAPDTYGALYEGGKSSFIRRLIYKQVRTDRTIKQITAKEVSDVDEVFSTLPYDVAVQPITDILSKTTPAPEYLLLLDGLNEVSSVTIEETGLSVVQMIMREIGLLISECPNVRVVLTSRSDEAAIYKESISRLYLSGVEDSTIKDYLESYELSKEQIDKVLEDDNLCETLQIPLFLTMYASLSNYDDISTQGEILKLFFNERRKNISVYTMQERLAQVEKNITDVASAVQKNRIDADMQNFILDFILPEIAWSLERNGEFYLSVRNIRKIIEPILSDTDDLAFCGEFGREIFSKYRNGASAKMHTYKVAKRIVERLGDDITEVTESIINCCVFAFGIMQESNGKYGFVHQHIRDYFAALKNINTIRLSVYLYEENENELALECMNKAFKDEPVNYTTRRFMGEYLGEHRNKPYYENKKWNYGVPSEKCDRNLLKRVLGIYRGHFDDECGYGIYTIVQILKEIREDLRGSDFSCLNMKMCNLNGHKLGENGLVANFKHTMINREVLFPSGHFDAVLSMRFDSDGKTLLTTSKDKTAKLWEVKTGKCLHTFIGHNAAVNYGEFNSNGELIVTASDDGHAIIWSTKTGQKMFDFCGHNGALSSASFSHNNKYIVTVVLFRSIEIWDIENKKRINILDEDAGRINKAYFSSNDEKIVTNMMGPIRLSKLKLLDVNKKDVQFPLLQYEDIVTSVAVSPQENRVTFSSTDARVYSFSTEDKSLIEVKENHSQYVISIEYSPNGEFFITNSLDKTARIFNSQTKECIAAIKAKDNPFTCFTINNDGSIIAVAENSNISIYEAKNNKLIHSIKGFNLPISNVSFSPSGKTFAFSSNDLLSFWSSETLEYLFTLKTNGKNIFRFCFCSLEEYNDDKIMLIFENDNNLIGKIDAMQFEKCENMDLPAFYSTYLIDDFSSSLILTKEHNLLFVRKDGALEKTIESIYGLLAKDVNLKECHSKTSFSIEEIDLLKQYGVLVMSKTKE